MKKKGHWKIKSSQVKYQNPWIKVVEDQVLRPDNTDGIYAYVDIKSGISVLPIDNNNNIYLVQELCYAINKVMIKCVGGGTEPNESSLISAKRELEEELGIKAKKWKKICTTHQLPSMINTVQDLFIARDLSFVNSNKEMTEKINMIKIPLQKAFKMIKAGKITEIKTIVLIMNAFCNI